MSWYPLNVEADEDPMRLVREAKERGEEVRMITGVDPTAGDGGTIVIAWHIPSTNKMVIEGTVQVD